MIYTQTTQIDSVSLFKYWYIYVSFTIVIKEKGAARLRGREVAIWEGLEGEREEGSDIIWFL